MVRLVTVTTKGRVTIPADVRRELGTRPGDWIDFVRNASGRYELSVRRREPAGQPGAPRDAKPVGPADTTG
jgi:antitoxin PrlF